MNVEQLVFSIKGGGLSFAASMITLKTAHNRVYVKFCRNWAILKPCSDKMSAQKKEKKWEQEF